MSDDKLKDAIVALSIAKPVMEAYAGPTRLDDFQYIFDKVVEKITPIEEMSELDIKWKLSKIETDLMFLNDRKRDLIKQLQKVCKHRDKVWLSVTDFHCRDCNVYGTVKS